MTLQPIAGRVSYLPGANNLAVIAANGGAVAVDTGIDKETGRALRKALERAGLVLLAIVNTHHHADHVGGNAALLRHYPEAVVYAPPLEAALIRHPQLEPIYLSGGARPPAALRNKFVLAPGSPVHQELGAEPLGAGEQVAFEIAGLQLKLVGLPGHSPAQIGLLVDGVCIAADGLFGAGVIDKHGVPYAHDVAAQLASLAALGQLGADWTLPGHGPLIGREALADELAANRAAVERATTLVAAALAEPGDLGAVTERVLAALGRSLAGPPQYTIFCGAVAAHLALLEQQGRAQLAVEGGRLIWSLA
jgi:glyoxylase-like metal-dependent hydrolase (beta-lactamase superfamily II)